jgi:hypothetical protein
MLADYRIQMGRNLLRPMPKLLVSGQPSSETDSRKGLTLSGFASPRGNSGGPMFDAAGDVIGIVSHNISEGGGQRGPEVRHHHEDSPAAPAREELVLGPARRAALGIRAGAAAGSGARVEPEAASMRNSTYGWFLIGIGVVLLVVSCLADTSSLETQPGFGWLQEVALPLGRHPGSKWLQEVGVIIGILAIAVGLFMRRVTSR